MFRSESVSTSRCHSDTLHDRGGMLAVVLGVFVSVFAAGSAAFACGDIFDAACNLSHGGLSPGNIARQTQHAGQDAANTVAKAGQDVANALNELQASVLSGPALEQAIIASHNTAINGAMPIPPLIRQRLTRYASEDSMNRVRYKIGDNGFANLARLIEQGGLASAVTLIDVIVFRDPSGATDPSLWAHELTHVDQYQAWGVHSFAVQYARNARGVEDPAYAKGDGFRAWSIGVGQNPGLGVPVPPQAAYVTDRCNTRFGICQMPYPTPPGTPCHCGPDQGQTR